MIVGRFSRTFLWALGKQRWLRDLIPAAGEDENTIDWYVNDSEERPFLIVKAARKENWHASVTIHKLDSDGKFWTWEKHRWDDDCPFGYKSLVKGGRYPATFRSKKAKTKPEKVSVDKGD